MIRPKIISHTGKPLTFMAFIMMLILCIHPLLSKQTPVRNERLDELKEKAPAVSVTILPVRLLDRPNSQVARVVALLLERAGVERIEAPEEGFAGAGTQSVEDLQPSLAEYVRVADIQTEYVLYAEFIGTPRTGAQEVRGLLLDRSGNLVWSDSRKPGDALFEQIKPGDPMTCALLLVESLRLELGLPEPSKSEKPRGRWAEYWEKDSNLPPADELARIRQRQDNLPVKLKNAEVELFPVLLNGAPDSLATDNLAGLLRKADICKAEFSSRQWSYAGAPSSNQQKKLWDMAVRFREHLRQQGMESDYALLCSYVLDKETGKAYGSDFVLCDRDGEWVVVDLQNDHWKDFQTVSPRTAQDCNRLTVKRLTGYPHSEQGVK